MPDIEKKRQLRKHKMIATGLFLLMAVIYGIMVWLQHHSPQAWMGYVEAFSEAGMVGALADWFAVTALFKHPLGIPIPHTNLIERKKNELGLNLGKFVNENFTNPENIRPYIEQLDLAGWAADWLEKPANRLSLELEIKNVMRRIVEDLDDSEVEKFLSLKGIEILQEIDYQKIAASGINYLLEKEEHITLLESILPQIKTYINENENLILQRLAESRPFIAFLAGKKISREITGGLISFVEEVEGDKNHFVRLKLTENLESFADELEHTEKWKDKFEKLQSELITEDNLKPYIKDLWKTVKDMFLTQLETPEAPLHHYIEKNILNLSVSLSTDGDLRHRLNNWVRHFLYRMILKNRNRIEDLISSTVANWQGRELSEKLELEVGKDLQFIRVNGTLVGGLMGLLIYVVTHLFI